MYNTVRQAQKNSAMKQILKLTFVLIGMWLAGSPQAGAMPFPTPVEEARDTAILFRFVPGKRMFYSPFRGNDQSIRQAAELIERHRAGIEAGHAFVLIRGFCGSFGSQSANLAAAKNRSN